MKELELRAKSGTCTLSIGPLEEAFSDFSSEHVCVVTEQRLPASGAVAIPAGPCLQIQGGEDVKSLAMIESIYEFFLKNGVQRRSVVVGIGGGAVCDAVAFAAATYLRGVRCILAPTTLLAQVDAAVGGKSGVNFGGFKNLVGVIRQPECVVCDVRFLSNLPDENYREAFSEIIKHGLILDRRLCETLESSAARLLARETQILEEVIERSVRVKASVVERDENEGHERIALNFGHTLAHALEVCLGWSHGAAVGVGLMHDTILSSKLGIASVDLVDRVRNLLDLYQLEDSAPACDVQKLEAALGVDKKRSGKGIKLALLRAVGEHVISEMTHEEYLGSAVEFLGASEQ